MFGRRRPAMTIEIHDASIAVALRGEAERVSQQLGRTITTDQIVANFIDQGLSARGWSDGNKLTAVVA